MSATPSEPRPAIGLRARPLPGLPALPGYVRSPRWRRAFPRRLLSFLTALTVVLSSLPLSVVLPPGLLLSPSPAEAAGAMIFVNTFNDEWGENGLCSLREALINANENSLYGSAACVAGSADGVDTIILPAGTFTLTMPNNFGQGGFTGDLNIWSSVHIKGAGANATIIQACTSHQKSSLCTAQGGQTGINHRVFFIEPPSNNPSAAINVTIEGVTIRNGRDDRGGGGIATGPMPNGTVTLDKVLLENNRGIAGGGLFVDTGTVNVVNSTIKGNFATEYGGGIVNFGTLNVTNSTVTGNSTPNWDRVKRDGVPTGGGLRNLKGTATFNHATITGNHAEHGGGLHMSDGSVTLKNTILAGNSMNGGIVRRDCVGFFHTGGHNIIGITEPGACQPFSHDPTDILGTIDAGVHVGLGPLQDNGGGIPTHAIAYDSQAIDAANDTGCPSTDQRGLPRPALGQGTGVAQCDIGAFEKQNDPPVAHNDTFTFLEDQTLSVPAPGVLGNDNDPNGNTLTAQLTSYPQRGTLTFRPDGSFTYVPIPDRIGTESFTYRPFDGNKFTGDATVTLTISNVNDPPTFTVGPSQSVSHDAGPRTVFSWIPITALSIGPANDAGQALTGFIVSNDRPDLFTVQPAVSLVGTLTFTPKSGTSGTAVVTVRLQDNGGTTNGGVDTSAPQTFTITVNNTAHSITNPASTNTTGAHSSLALNGSGNPVISFYSESGSELVVQTCSNPTCTGNFNLQSRVDMPDTVGLYTSLALDGNGLPVVSYYDATSGNLKVLHCNDVQCIHFNESLVAVDTAGDVGQNTSLVLDGNGRPLVSYDDVSNGSVKLLHCNDANCAGGDESVVTVAGSGRRSSLVLDASGYPVLSYYSTSGGNLHVVHCNDANCAGGDESNVAADSGDDVGEYSSVRLDSSGHPVVSYYDATQSNLKLLHCNDANCAGGDESIVTVDANGSVGEYTSLRLNASGHPVISYYDAGNGDLKIAVCNDANCAGGDERITSPDTPTNVGQFTSLRLDSNGFPVVSYYDVTNGDLKLLRCTNAFCSPNVAPAVVNDAYSLDEDTVLTVNAAAGVLANDTDNADDFNDTLSALLVTGPAHGQLTLNLNGSFTYTPHANYRGPDSFTYKANDGRADSATATASITVDPVDDPTSLTLPGPQAILRNGTVRFGTAVTVADVDAFTLTVTLTATNGVVTLKTAAGLSFTAGDGTSDAAMTFSGSPAAVNAALDGMAFIAAADYTGAASLAVSAEQSGGAAGPASGNIAITVTQAGNSVTYPDITAAVGAGSTISMRLDSSGNPVIVTRQEPTATTANFRVIHCNDPDCAGGDEPVGLVTDAVKVGLHHALALDGNGYPVIAYNAHPNGLRLVHCNDAVCAGNDESNTLVDAAGRPEDPLALALDAGGFPVIAYYDRANGDLKVAHCNDANCAGGNESIVASDSTGDVGQFASLVLDGDGFPVITYYDRTSGDLRLLHCTHVNCHSGSGGLVAVAIVGDVGKDSQVRMDASGNPVISYTAGGSVVVLHCTDAYCAAQAESRTTPSPATAAIVPELALDGSGFPVLALQSAANGPLTLVRCNDGNCAGGDEASAIPDAAPLGGRNVALALDGSGLPVVAYVEAGSGAVKLLHCGTASCVQTFVPAALNDAYSGTEDGAFAATAAQGVLANDTSLAGQSISATLVDDVSNGTLTLNADGSFNYEPDADFNGQDTFTYKVTGGVADSNVATVTLTVAAVNDPPSFTAGADQTVEPNAGTQTVPDWAANLSTGPANESSQSLTGFVLEYGNGDLFLDLPIVGLDGTLTYSVKAGVSGSSTVTVRLKDDGGSELGGADTSAPHTFTITAKAFKLTSLGLSAGTLAPAFDPDVLSYTVDLPAAVTSLKVTPVTGAGGAIEVRFDGGDYAAVASGQPSAPLVLTSGTHTVDIKVTSTPGGASTQYALSVTAGSASYRAWIQESQVYPNVTEGATGGASVFARNLGTATWNASGPNPVVAQVRYLAADGSPLSGRTGALQDDTPPGGMGYFGIIELPVPVSGAAKIEVALHRQGLGPIPERLVKDLEVQSFRGSMSMIGIPTYWSPGQTRSFEVGVANGGADWEADTFPRVLLRARFAGGTYKYFPLPFDMLGNFFEDIPVTLTAPETLGPSQLEFAMVRENSDLVWAETTKPAHIVPAYAAEIDPWMLPQTWLARRSRTFEIFVSNTGAATWETSGPGRVVVRAKIGDRPYQYFDLPFAIQAENAQFVELTMNAPGTAGPTQVELALVHSGSGTVFGVQNVDVMVTEGLTGGITAPASPVEFTAGKTRNLTIPVQNTAAPEGATWANSGASRIVLRAKLGDKPYVYGDLAEAVAPGGTGSATVAVSAPTDAGDTTLELALMQAGAATPFVTETVDAAVVPTQRGVFSNPTADVPATWSRDRSQTFTVRVANTALLDGAIWTTSGAGRVVVRARIGSKPYVYTDLSGSVPPGETGVSLPITLQAPSVVGNLDVELALLPAGSFTPIGTASALVTVSSEITGTIDPSGIAAEWTKGRRLATGTVQVTNTLPPGSRTWAQSGSGRVVLRVTVPGGPHQYFDLPHDVAPGASAVVPVSNLTAIGTTGPATIEFALAVAGQVPFTDPPVTKSITVKEPVSGTVSLTSAAASFTAGKVREVSVQVTNTAAPDGNVWQTAGAGRVVLQVRLAQTATPGSPPTKPWVYADLASPVAPGASATVTVSLTAPDAVGEMALEAALVPAGSSSAFARDSRTVAIVAALQGTLTTGNVPLVWERGQAQTFTVGVQNTALADGRTWLAAGNGRVWLRARFGGGTPSPYVYGSLAADVAPGAAGTASVTLTAPQSTGSVPVELDLVVAGSTTPFAPVPGPAGVTVTVRAALQASISPAGIPTVWTPGETKTLSVTVTNSGSSSWTATGSNPMVLMAKFVHATMGASIGTVKLVDLGGDVAAGATVTLSVTLTAPGDLAEVALDVQMVRQGVGPVPANLRLPVTTPPII